MLPQDVLPKQTQRMSYTLKAIQEQMDLAGSGVIKDVPAGQTVWWFPARPIKRVKEELAALAFVPRVVKQLSRPKRKVRRSFRR